MHLVRYQKTSEPRIGVLLDEWIFDVEHALRFLSKFEEHDSGATANLFASDMRALLAAGPLIMEQIKRAVSILADSCSESLKEDEHAGIHARSKTTLLAPIANPHKIICAWVNYPHPHLPASQEPIFFNKFPSTLIGPDAEIVLPANATQVIPEAELAIVVGKKARHVSEAEAPRYIAGFTILNDVTALDFRLEALTGYPGPYFLGKNFDTFAPIGPAIVTTDQLSLANGLNVKAFNSGELVWEGNTSKMRFSVSYLVSYLSRFFELMPGDLISTGSPNDTNGRKRVALRPGDVFRINIDGIGELSNAIVQGE